MAVAALDSRDEPDPLILAARSRRCQTFEGETLEEAIIAAMTATL